MQSSKASIASVPLTADERKRRLVRMSRFCVPSKPNPEPDPSYRPLSTPRIITSTGNKKVNKLKGKRNENRLVGENTNLEKAYLRLTTFPRKEDVRPLEVLVQSLAHIKTKYIREEDFSWANEQLKSVRQDITVQGIRSPFTLEVYETHARILLEHGDLNEFNQCQTMIRSLSEGSNISPEGSDSAGDLGAWSTATCDSDMSQQPLCQSEEAGDEFRGYAILYALVRNSWSELKTELSRTRSVLQSKTKAKCSRNQHLESSSWHALNVVTAVSENDYRTFFRLYESAPHMSAYIMDFLVKRVRDGAYERIIAAYRPSVSVEHFRECLCLHSLEETRHFLQERGAVFVEEKGDQPFSVDCAKSKAKLLTLTNPTQPAMDEACTTQLCYSGKSGKKEKKRNRKTKKHSKKKKRLRSS